MKIIEIFDTRLEMVWKSSGRFLLTSFILNDKKFVIQIDNRPLYDVSSDLKNKKTAEISFYGEEGFSTIFNDNKNSIKIYSIVYNAISEKVSEYDAIYFKIDLQHSKSPKEYKSKKRIYKTLVDKLKGMFNNFVYEKHLGANGFGYLLTKEKIRLTESLRCIPIEYMNKVFNYQQIVN